MDDQNQNNQSLQDQNQVQPVTVPISISQKEQEPVVVGRTSEYLTSSEQEPSLNEEVERAGVEKIEEKPHLTEEQEKLGVRHVGEAIEPKTEPEGRVNLSMTEDEIRNIERKEKPSNSIKWLASLIKKAWKKIKGRKD